ncbi:phosphatidylinositol-3,5-bisphosphate 5-phosphatase [Starmerella bacillaris]|uniref:Phosphatidylinositol-3,5-bisphosphate 5-phosphatase n=1 Tax=Starmerella bacillaris TaxID=1247836 RepID=A0AAV5RIZ2_STABA|nr:phosphatidylinositol-3,5-bisphosphate 5-phosphatase [Starmerella bacillaris]
MSTQLVRFTLYEASKAFWIIGQNEEATIFQILKIEPDMLSSDKSRSHKFVLTQLERTFDEHQIRKWISKQTELEGLKQKATPAWAILGTIRFTNCYYLVLVTKCSVVSLLGGHKIYHIDETELVPLIHSSVYETPDRRSIEGRLISTFYTLDLSKTFYFSPTYDLTNTLQTNLNNAAEMEQENNTSKADSCKLAKSKQRASKLPKRANTKESKEAKEAKDSKGLHTSRDTIPEIEPVLLADPSKKTCMSASQRSKQSSSMFVWNSHLLAPLKETGPLKIDPQLRKKWFTVLIHGFIDQARISVFGNHITITIIARRSRHFAGVRFYKRGVNNEGFPANEVETEQIVSNELASQFDSRYTSYVQHRGSICVNWSQMSSNMSPQPPIKIDSPDPYYTPAAKHFDRMFGRYGYPIRILNLVKTKEKRPRESTLSKEFEICIQYLNQFLPPERSKISTDLKSRSFKNVHPTINVSKSQRKSFILEGGCIEYTHWDMSRAAKSRSTEVMDYLGKYANRTLEATSIFQTGISNQNGVCRTNCVDCLDRTNAAQSVIAKYALGYQLCALGIIDKPKVEYDTDVIDLLTEMYHDHGDTLALQYGGSNLVNTVETYRRINQWSSHSRDLIESVRRYYTNSFIDAQRQDAINVFLGNYQYVDGLNLWDLSTDYYLHNKTPKQPKYTFTGKPTKIESDAELVMKRSYQQWYEPRHLIPQGKPVKGLPICKSDDDYHKYTPLDDLFTFTVNSIDKYSQSISPFHVHDKKRKRRIENDLNENDIVSIPEDLHSELVEPEPESEYNRYLTMPESELTAVETNVPLLEMEYLAYFQKPVMEPIDTCYNYPAATWQSTSQLINNDYLLFDRYAHLEDLNYHM